ncbi:hypothetical protein T484DRAFT_1815802 [Baffinella frigidus]|nr:hypothetical protein T484DRAFT_1815802 [Cryptophyta sp. CCMP2293]
MCMGTEKRVHMVRDSYTKWWTKLKAFAFDIKNKAHEDHGDWPDYIWAYFNQDEKPLEASALDLPCPLCLVHGEDVADAKKRHQLLVSEILHRYVEHARTHDKLLGIRSKARSAAEIETSGIDFERELRGVVSVTEFILKAVAVDDERIGDLDERMKKMESLVGGGHSMEDLHFMLRPFCTDKGFLACVAYKNLDLKRGWTLGFAEKWPRGTRASQGEINRVANDLWRALGEDKLKAFHFERVLRKDVGAISEQFPGDWRAKVQELRDEALTLAREDGFEKFAGGWFLQLLAATKFRLGSGATDEIL